MIARDSAEPQRVSIDLDFEDLARAEAMLARLKQVWQAPTARAAVDGAIRATITEQVEVRVL